MKKTITFFLLLHSLMVTNSFAQWMNRFCTTCAQGCYINGGTLTPTATLQTKNNFTGTSNYGYIYWTFTASAGTTYYFDLCNSSGVSSNPSATQLRLHNARNTSPNNNYCMDGNNTPTLVLANIYNGCAGAGTGFSKLIWTCIVSGTYYLESVASEDLQGPTYWGVQNSATATLRYKTLPSSSTVCSDVFTDKGGDGTNGSYWNYNNNEDWTYTYYPGTPGWVISVQFNSFFTSGWGDNLYVYNGNSTAAPLMDSIYGWKADTAGTFTSTAPDGSLTFRFKSDDQYIDSGWTATVSCVQALNTNSPGSVSRIKIYPNPVKDRLIVYGLPFTVATNVEIYNLIGEKVYHVQLSAQPSNNKSQSISVSGIHSGVYFINIENANGKWNGRFVKE